MRYILLTLLLACSTTNAADVSLNWPSQNPTKTCIFSTTSAVGTSMTGDFVSGECPAVQPSTPSIINDLSELPATALTNSITSVNWAANADNCTYYNSRFPTPVASWPTGLSLACNNIASCGQGKNVSITFPNVAGTYQFSLTCAKNGGTGPVTVSKTVQVSTPSPTGCVAPAGLRRQTEGLVAYNNGSERSTDFTKFESVFGHSTLTSELRLFPGTANLNQRVYLTKGYYAALKFTVPTTLAVGTYGQFRFEETQPQTNPARMSFVISRQCGDFTASLAQKCVADNGPANTAVLWGIDPNNPNKCSLVPGETYYLNIVHASLAAPLTSYCKNADGTCGNTMQHQRIQGTW